MTEPNARSSAAEAIRLLPSINSPADLRRLSSADLPRVAQEIRELMLEKVSQTGGHLAPSLGVVELSIALHYVYDTPRDKLLWDVGHQAYAHKILTGRRDAFDGLRKYGGISGFPRITESDYDAFSTGHASTSISAGLGMAVARDRTGEKHEIVAVIGDGSLSGGLAFEGLNNLGMHATKMTVVLNDNKMSISRNVGALSRYLTRLITDRRFHKIKSEVWELLGNMTDMGKRIRNLVHNVDDALKHFVIPGKLFEDMGLRYLGPVDGHNISEMIEVLKFAKDSLMTPVLIHVLTTKGKGYSFAENDATKYHGISKFSVQTGSVSSDSSAVPKYSDVFGSTLVELAREHKEIVAITAAMPDGTGLRTFMEEFPSRFFDVGIAESHAVTFAAGLAANGLKPVVAIYSTFLQRAYDQILHDIALDKLHVVFCVDRAGLVGEDGPTHHGMFDLTYLRSIPNVVIMTPRNEHELRAMIRAALLQIPGPVCIRYPRGNGTGEPPEAQPVPIAVGTPEILVQGSGCALVAAGEFCATAREASLLLEKSGVTPTLVNARFVKPLDEECYRSLFSTHSHIVTLEGNTLAGGFGSALLELAHRLDLPRVPRFLRIGLPDEFVAHGEMSVLINDLKLDSQSVATRIASFLSAEKI
jgi:1-deoxy-D-xylulose-5-phosphate synthase